MVPSLLEAGLLAQNLTKWKSSPRPAALDWTLVVVVVATLLYVCAWGSLIELQIIIGCFHVCVSFPTATSAATQGNSAYVGFEFAKKKSCFTISPPSNQGCVLEFSQQITHIIEIVAHSHVMFLPIISLSLLLMHPKRGNGLGICIVCPIGCDKSSGKK
jgi:hypothetical protein